MTHRRTEFAAFVLDLMDFIEEKIDEAMADETSRVAAIGEAAGGVPVLRDRLGENEVVQANFILVLRNIIERRWASDWWDDFARMDRLEFEDRAAELKRMLAALREVVAPGACS
ncbi:hypothetical protein [Bradyrhizobium guangzhouense]|nr:hypothetical protein [Bradyrhizobium guangzhouense]